MSSSIKGSRVVKDDDDLDGDFEKSKKGHFNKIRYFEYGKPGHIAAMS